MIRMHESEQLINAVVQLVHNLEQKLCVNMQLVPVLMHQHFAGMTHLLAKPVSTLGQLGCTLGPVGGINKRGLYGPG